MNTRLQKLQLLGAAAVLGAFASVSAETRLTIVWTCTLNDGYSVEDMVEAQANWVAWVNAQPFGEDIAGWVAAPMMGADLGTYMYVDSYPDRDAWFAELDAYESSDGEALDAQFEEVSTCGSSAMYLLDDGK